MNKILVIMLSNTADQNIKNMTDNALNTMRQHKGRNDLECVLVETNVNALGCYEQEFVHHVSPNESFNYNRFINFGYEFARSFWPQFFAENDDNKYVVIANNDLIFHEYWADKLINGIVENNLDSVSPKNPGWQFHHNYTEYSVKSGVFEGWGIGHEFCGWLQMYKKESWDRLFPLDERFLFWCQDTDMTINMQKMNMKHALIVNALVTHLTSQSHRLIPHDKHHLFTSGMGDVLNEKINNGEYERG